MGSVNKMPQESSVAEALLNATIWDYNVSKCVWQWAVEGASASPRRARGEAGKRKGGEAEKEAYTGTGDGK